MKIVLPPFSTFFPKNCGPRTTFTIWIAMAVLYVVTIINCFYYLSKLFISFEISIIHIVKI